MTDTFPVPVEPADATILALNGTTHQKTGLKFIAQGVGPTSSPSLRIQGDTQLRRMFELLAKECQGYVVKTDTLKIGVYPLDYTIGWEQVHFEGTTGVSIDDDATTYIWIDDANTLQTGASLPDDVSAHWPLAKVVAAGGVMTITDLGGYARNTVAHNVDGVLPIASGGTGAATAADARANLSAAVSGDNDDITDLTALGEKLPFCPHFYLPGELSVKVYEIEYVAPVDLTIKNATGRVNTAPTGAALICDIRVNGTSIFGDNQADMINIADGEQQDTSATEDYAITAGQIITLEIEQVGSGTAGSDLTVVLNGRTEMQG